VWPRAVYADWYLNWGVLIMTGVLGVVGGLLCWHVFPAGAAAEASPAEAATGQATPVEAPAAESPVPGAPAGETA
jgi:hypothetical protein